MTKFKFIFIQIFILLGMFSTIEFFAWFILNNFSETYKESKLVKCSRNEFDPFLGHRHLLDKNCNQDHIKNAKLINKHWVLHTNDEEIKNSMNPIKVAKNRNSFVILTLGALLQMLFLTIREVKLGLIS